MIPETTLAYCAGLFDGEGCITLSRHYTYSKRKETSYGRQPNYRYRLSIVLNQVRHEGVRLMHQTWGGQIRYIERRRKSPTTGNAYSARWWWELNDRQAFKALTDMLPYLLLKTAEVNLAIQFQATRLPANDMPQAGRSRKLGRTAREVAFQEWAFEEMKNLKHLHNLPSTHEYNLLLIESFRQLPRQ